VSGNLESALEIFKRARAYVESSDSRREVEWQRTRRVAQFTETDLLREAAWVILCSGFREAIVRRRFDYISLSFCDWETAGSIVKSAGACRASALASLGNAKKMDAIVGVAERIYRVGFVRLKQRILSEPINELRKFPFIGPVTSWHLAKNLGFEVAKPDRHLVRLCRSLGFCDVQELCRSIAQTVGEAVHVVDLVLWRYAVDGFRSPPYGVAPT